MKILDKERVRREPRQGRSRQTVDAVLDAVQRVLKRHGIEAITTNRIAEAAGVSIGSVYQYFPDKQAIFTALHNRHVDQVGRVIERALATHASASLEDFTCALVEGLVDVHAADPEVHEIIATAVPEGAQGFRDALRETFERMIPPHETRLLYVLPGLVEALVHGATKHEAVLTVLAYLNAYRTPTPERGCSSPAGSRVRAASGRPA